MERFSTILMAAIGTRKHKFAKEAIELGVKLAKSPTTLNMYVNDCIGFGMKPEVILYFSDNCFGQADAIKFDERKKLLRIFDLKTGETPAHVEQLEVYAALFCLEYNFRPFDIEFDLRIYQLDQIFEFEADKNAIMHIMEQVKLFDRIINEMKMEALT